MIITIDLDIPIGFVLDDCCGGFRDAVQTPGLYSSGFCVIYTAWGIKRLGVGNNETKIVLAMGVV